MSYSKIAQIALYVAMGISVLVIGFFYFGDSLVNTEEYEAKVAKLEAPADMMNGYTDQAQPVAEEDTTAVADTTAVEEVVTDSTIVEELADSAAAVVEDLGESIASEVDVVEEETVRLNFMERLVYKRTDIALVWAYILVIITMVFSIVFPIINMIGNPKGLVRGLLILVAIAVLIGIAYAFGSGETIYIPGFDGTDNSNPRVLRMVDTGLIFTYFLLGMTVLAILYSSVSNVFKK